MRESMTTGRKAAFARLRDDWKPPLQAVQPQDGAVAASPAEIMKSIRDDWDSLYKPSSQIFSRFT